MRVDGSVKTVTAGATTLDDKRHSGIYAKQVDNFRCDPDYGLVKRPPLNFIRTILTGDAAADAIFLPFVLDTEDYWLMVEEGVVSVINSIGEIEDVDQDTGSENYLDGVTEASQIATTTLENALVIGSTVKEVSVLDLLDVRNKSSMVIVKQAPAPLSTIELQFTTSEGNSVAITPLVIGDENSDRGTNTVAQLLGNAMAGVAPLEDQIFVQGSTVLYERSDQEYAQITATDGARDTVVATLNSDTADIANLGKYAGADSVVQIRPDPTSDRGSYWMRADPDIFLEDDEPLNTPSTGNSTGNILRQAPEHVMTVGSGDILDQLARGYFYEWFGSIVPPTQNEGDIVVCMQRADASTATQITTTLWIYGLWEQEDLEYINFVNENTGEIHGSATEWIGHEEDDTTSATIYQLTSSGDILWTPGHRISIYYGYQSGLYGKLPEVIWREDANPELPNTLDSTTMPHVLGKRTDGTWSYGRMDDTRGIPGIHQIRKRQAGNDETNPMPAFVDTRLNDISKFQNRLLVMSTDGTSQTITNKPYAWFRETATQQLSTDPIDIKSSATESYHLNHVVSHNNDALLFSKAAQFKLNGNTSMTSQNAAMPQTTSYENNPRVKPISNGSDVFFVTEYSKVYAGVSRYSVDKDNDAQDIAISITPHVQEYIKGTVMIMDSSATLNMLLCVTKEEPSVLYLFEYRDAQQNSQAAWSRWEIFQGLVHIRAAKFSAHSIEILGNSYTTNALILMDMPINPDGQIGTDHTHYLDNFSYRENVNLEFEINDYIWERTMVIVFQGEGCPTPGEQLPYTVSGDNQRIILETNMQGGTVVFGYPYTSTWIPSRRWVRDDSGTPQTASKLRITDYGFHAHGTNIHVDIQGGPSTWPTQVFTNSEIDQDKYHRVSFKQRHDEADLVISSDDAKGITLHQLEWRGTYFKTGRRF